MERKNGRFFLNQLDQELCSLMEAGGRRIEEYDAYASLCQRCDVVWAHVDDVDDEILGA